MALSNKKGTPIHSPRQCPLKDPASPDRLRISNYFFLTKLKAAHRKMARTIKNESFIIMGFAPGGDGRHTVAFALQRSSVLNQPGSGGLKNNCFPPTITGPVVIPRYNFLDNNPFTGGQAIDGHPVSGCLTVGFSSVLALMKDRKKKEERFVDPRNALIGARIQALRIAAGYTSQEKAAYSFGISRSQWADYEKGAEMKLTTLWRICDAFGITPQEFFSKGFK